MFRFINTYCRKKTKVKDHSIRKLVIVIVNPIIMGCFYGTVLMLILVVILVNKLYNGFTTVDNSLIK